MTPSKDTVVHNVKMTLGDPSPTISHDFELTYIGPKLDENGHPIPEIIATGELVEPEILIKTDTEDILIERVHPAFILSDTSDPEDESDQPDFMQGKPHMDVIDARSHPQDEFIEHVQAENKQGFIPD